MSDRSKESREDMLERILAETAKNPYVPRKQIRPSQRNDTPQSRMAASKEKVNRQGGADPGIPVTRILTEAQKAEAAKARAAKKVEEMRRARLEREVQEERRITEVLKNKPVEVPEDNKTAPENVSESVTEDIREDIQENTPENAGKSTDGKKTKKRPGRKRKARSRKASDDSGIWDPDSGVTEAENLEENNQFGLNDMLEILESAIAVILVVMMVFTYVVRVAVVDGKSMNPTLKDKDRLILRSLMYTPECGDVVVVDNRSSHLISDGGKVIEKDGLNKVIVKRVIAVGGQTVDIDFKSATVKVDGKVLEEKYINEPTTRDEHAFKYPLEVPEGYVFVMGDNRNYSMDSRHPQVGFVPENKILGEVIFRVYPFDRFGNVE